MTAEQPRDLHPGHTGQAMPPPAPADPAPEIGEIVASVTAEGGTNLITVSRRVETAGPGAAQTVVAVAGEIDQDTADLVQRALRQALGGHRPVCCDLRGVTFFGAAAAHMLLAAHQDAERTGPSRGGGRREHRTRRRSLTDDAGSLSNIFSVRMCPPGRLRTRRQAAARHQGRASPGHHSGPSHGRQPTGTVPRC